MLLGRQLYLIREVLIFGLCPKKVSLKSSDIACQWPLTEFIGCQSLSQVYAIESQTFVLHATTVIKEKGIKTMSTEAGLLMNSPGGGASAIFGPDGRLLTAPLDSATEGLIFADLDFTAAIFAKSFLDICGHYSRPDLLWLGRDTKKKLPRVDSGN